MAFDDIMVSASQIREAISEFLENRIDLSSFEDWIVQYTWNVHRSGSVAAEHLAFDVEESLSQYSNRNINERDLRDRLALILSSENKVVEISRAPQLGYHFLFRASAPVTLVAVRR